MAASRAVFRVPTEEWPRRPAATMTGTPSRRSVTTRSGHRRRSGPAWSFTPRPPRCCPLKGSAETRKKSRPRPGCDYIIRTFGSEVADTLTNFSQPPGYLTQDADDHAAVARCLAGDPDAF